MKIKKEISTKNLYLLEVKRVKESKFFIAETWSNSGVNYSEIRTGTYIIGRRHPRQEHVFYDIFTKSIYKDKFDMSEIKKGAQRVEIISPIVFNKSKITYDEAVSILQKYNPCLMDKECEYKDNTNRLLSVLHNFNNLAKTKPEEAEEVATEILNVLDEHFNESKEANTEEPNKKGISKVYIRKKQK